MLIWLALMFVFSLDVAPIGPVVIAAGSALSFGYLLQGRLGTMVLAEHTVLVRMFPSIFGNFSAICVMGILFKVMQWPGASVMANIGIIGMLICSLALFYTPIQNEFLPVMRKFLIRLAVLVGLSIYVAI